MSLIVIFPTKAELALNGTRGTPGEDNGVRVMGIQKKKRGVTNGGEFQ